MTPEQEQELADLVEQDLFEVADSLGVERPIDVTFDSCKLEWPYNEAFNTDKGIAIAYFWQDEEYYSHPYTFTMTPERRKEIVKGDFMIDCLSIYPEQEEREQSTQVIPSSLSVLGVEYKNE